MYLDNEENFLYLLKFNNKLKINIHVFIYSFFFFFNNVKIYIQFILFFYSLSFYVEILEIILSNNKIRI